MSLSGGHALLSIVSTLDDGDGRLRFQSEIRIIRCKEYMSETCTSGLIVNKIHAFTSILLPSIPVHSDAQSYCTASPSSESTNITRPIIDSRQESQLVLIDEAMDFLHFTPYCHPEMA